MTVIVSNQFCLRTFIYAECPGSGFPLSFSGSPSKNQRLWQKEKIWFCLFWWWPWQTVIWLQLGKIVSKMTFSFSVLKALKRSYDQSFTPASLPEWVSCLPATTTPTSGVVNLPLCLLVVTWFDSEHSLLRNYLISYTWKAPPAYFFSVWHLFQSFFLNWSLVCILAT